MVEHYLQCVECKSTYDPDIFILKCKNCSGVLRVIYNQKSFKDKPLLPIQKGDILFLGVVDTSLIELKSSVHQFNLSSVSAKLEMLSPTGSFKDRGSSILISMAKVFGVNEFVEDSSGNAGASLSAYAAAAKIKANIFVPKSASKGKISQIKIFGANLHMIEGLRQLSTDAAERYVKEMKIPYLSHNLSPYFSEGMKKISYELINQLNFIPDHVVLPVGNGSLLIGMFRGFQEINSDSVKINIPKFHAIQSNNVRPIFDKYKHSVKSETTFTVASGISVSNPPRIKEILEIIYETNGTVNTVGDDSIIFWQKKLSEEEGIFCEPTSSAALSGLEILVGNGTIKSGESVVVPITGNGLKEPL